MNSAVQKEIEPINLLFNSTLNIEFVYVILEGIVKFSKLSFDSDERLETEFADRLSYEREGQDVTFHVTEIEMQSVEKWEASEAQEHIKRDLSRRMSRPKSGGALKQSLHSFDLVE